MADTDLIEKYGLARSGHSLFAPSSASGWLACPGYVLANAQVQDTAGSAAAYGTVAHELAEQSLRGRDLTPLIGQVRQVREHKVTIDTEMIGFIGDYVKWCQSLPGDHFIEQQIDLSFLMPIPNQGGTADHFACEPSLLTITDLKMGLNVRVYAKQNPQAMLYAIGAFDEWDWIYGFQNIVIRICQPRLGVFDVWQLSRQELLDFGAEVRTKAAAAWSETAPRVPSPTGCTWCKVRSSCTAIAEQLSRVADATFDDLEVTTKPNLKPAASLTIEELTAKLRWRKLFEDWFATLAEELEHRALVEGVAVPGYKIVQGNKTRAWGNAEVATDLMIVAGVPPERITTRSYITPPQAEKELRKAGWDKERIKAFMSGQVVEKTGNLALVPESDRRRAVGQVADDSFDDVTETGEP